MIRCASRTVPCAIWKNPGRKAGLLSSASATACSAGNVYRRVAASYSTKPPAACAFNHSRAYGSPVLVRSASSPAVVGP
jgi:hypothetical protein